MTTIAPGQIAALRKGIADDTAKRIAAETRQQASVEEEARLLAEAREQYGLDTLAALRAHIDAEVGAIAVDIAAVEAARDDAARAVAAVPS